jgi:tetratricopeptide (TPR) repeat protein
MQRDSWMALLLLCFFGAGGVLADAPDEARAREHFSAGTQAVQDGDFAAALAAFRAAAAAGLPGPAVHYNIGVSAWELGKLDEAEAAFLLVADYPSMSGLASYNLGLVALRRGDDAVARSWFERARASDDEAVRRLASVQLGALAPAAAAERSAIRPPIMLVTTRAGYDDNVVLVADGEVLGISDTGSSFAEVQLAGLVPLGASLRMEGSAYVVRYPQLEEFNQSGARAGLLAGRDIGAWTTEFGLDYDLNHLDGKRFEDRLGLSVTTVRTLSDGWDLRFRYRFEDVTGREPYVSLSGDRRELAIRLRRRADTSRLRLDYRFETNDRAGDAVSPDRHTLEAEWTHELPARLEGVLGLAWRHSSYSPAEGAWTERRSLVSAGVRGQLAGRWTWTAGYDWTDNDSADPLFDYVRRRVFAGVEALF